MLEGRLVNLKVLEKEDLPLARAKKGYGSEAVKIIVDYLFLSKELVRVQAITGVDNFAS